MMSLMICDCCSSRLTEDEASRPEKICGDCRRTFEAIEQLAPSYKLHVLAAAVFSDRAEICARLGCGLTIHLSGLGNASTKTKIGRARLVGVAAWAIETGRIERPRQFAGLSSDEDGPVGKTGADYSDSIPEASPATAPAVEATPPAGGSTRGKESTDCPAGQPNVEAEPPAPIHCAIDGEAVDQETFDRALKQLVDAGRVAHSKGTLASHLPTASATGRLEPEEIVVDDVRLVPCADLPDRNGPGKWERVIIAFLASGLRGVMVETEGDTEGRAVDTIRSAIARGGYDEQVRAAKRGQRCYLIRTGEL